MVMKASFQLGPIVTVGKFHKRQISTSSNTDIQFTSFCSTIQQVVLSKTGRGKDLLQVRLNKSDSQQIIKVESQIRQILKNDLATAKIKSEIRDGLITLYFQKTNGQIQTEIYDQDDTPISIGDLQVGDQVKVILSCNSIWSRTDYYPSFLYKWKIVKIQIVECV